MIRSIEWRSGTVRFLDQTLLPSREEYVETADIEVLAEAVERLKVRGAPLLGIAAAYGVLLGVRSLREAPLEGFLEAFTLSVDRLSRTRPTARNLFGALERMRGVVRLNPRCGSGALYTLLEQEALAVHDEDRRLCDSIGFYGAQLIEEGARILTHCNTGALATGGIGTALGAVVTAHAAGRRLFVFADETRPLFQGARLTMWELQKAGIPAALITDGSAAWTMLRKGIDLVIVGADRIAMNGDTANKIGTYQLAIAARAHGIPFYVAAPRTTIDETLPDGSGIPIEERTAVDLLGGFAAPIAPDGAEVFAPAFDVTPGALITAVITERGIHRQPYERSLREALAP